ARPSDREGYGQDPLRGEGMALPNGPPDVRVRVLGALRTVSRRRMTARDPLTVAAIQMSCGPDPPDNVERAEALVRKAAAEGERLILLPELFEHRYFPKDQAPENFSLAREASGHPTVER